MEMRVEVRKVRGGRRWGRCEGDLREMDMREEGGRRWGWR